MTGTRADYGLLRPTIAAVHEDERFELQLIVAGMHLEERYGMTVDEIEADGFPIADRVPTGDAAEAEGGVATATERALAGFGAALRRGRPGVLLVLGDRYDALAAALAATLQGVAVGHLHGGERSEGSIDDAMRHAITKLAHLHFVATREYAERVVQLGEEQWRVHLTGAAALESIATLDLLGRDALAAELGLSALESPVVSLTLHPTSLEPGAAQKEAEATVAALDAAVGEVGTVIVSLPNDDPGNEATRAVLERWVADRQTAHAFASLGQLRYLSLLSHTDVVVGNSSSGLLETPSFRVPVVNIGDRQAGRVRAANVIDVPATVAEITVALERALDPAFRDGLRDLRSPYGEGDVSRRVLEALASAPPLEQLRRKSFVDLPEGPWRAALELAP